MPACVLVGNSATMPGCVPGIAVDLLRFSIGVLYPFSHNAIFDDLRHFYIFMWISMLVL